MVDTPKAASDRPQDGYDELAREYLTRPGVSVGRALSGDALKVNAKIFAFLKHDRLVVKLPAPQASALVADGEAVQFESGGRKMREWVSVGWSAAPAGPSAYDRWRALMSDAISYVATSSPRRSHRIAGAEGGAASAAGRTAEQGERPRPGQ